MVACRIFLQIVKAGITKIQIFYVSYSFLVKAIRTLFLIFFRQNRRLHPQAIFVDFSL
jgi:hypothetical protein